MASMAVKQTDGSFLTISEHGSSIERHNNSIRLPECYPTQARIQLLTPAHPKKARFCVKLNLRRRFSCANFCAVIVKIGEGIMCFLVVEMRGGMIKEK